MSSSMQASVQNRISDILNSQGLPMQNLLFRGSIQALIADKSEFHTALTDTLHSFGIVVNKSKDNIDISPLIKVQITVAEVRKGSLLSYGVDWPNSYSAQILPKVFGGEDAQSINFRFLESQGLAKVLASPNILCRSGKEANFLAGGEIPIKIINYKTQDVIWKQYGIVLKVQPRADLSGKMSIALESEVSSLDDAHAVDGVPGILTNKIQSTFDLSETRTIALSGLIKSEQSHKSQGLPGLSHIPILGDLFASKDFQENRTELVVFVRPEIVSSGSLEAKR